MMIVVIDFWIFPFMFLNKITDLVFFLASKLLKTIPQVIKYKYEIKIVYTCIVFFIVSVVHDLDKI